MRYYGYCTQDQRRFNKVLESNGFCVHGGYWFHSFPVKVKQLIGGVLPYELHTLLTWGWHQSRTRVEWANCSEYIIRVG